MAKNRLNYLVYAAPYDANSGGAIFLHQLAHHLGALGEDVSLWSWIAPPPEPHARRRVGVPPIGKTLASLELNPDLNTRCAVPKDLRKDTIVIYPEVTLGNPLKAKNIVRWLLYTPGVKDPYEFTEDEMFFRAGEMSDLPDLTGGAPDLFVWRRDRTYRNENRPDREGACYIVRKGFDKPRIPQTEDAICIDGLPHDQIAEIFNHCKTFYSYDEATFYSQYAAVCGCTSVVVPGRFQSREDWVANHPIGRVGVAYGLNDVAHAEATRHLVEEHLDQLERNGLDSVRNFVSLTQARFTAASRPKLFSLFRR